MSEPVQIQVSTGALKRILEDDPAILLKLQSMACEKIGEEIVRKVKDRTNSDEIDRLVNKVMDTAQADLSSRYRFPPAAKRIVEEIARAEVSREFAATQGRMLSETKTAMAAVTSGFEGRLTAIFEKRRGDFDAWAEKEVRRMAREEFIKTLTAVREGVAL